MRTILTLASCALIATAQGKALVTTYAKSYSDSARVHKNARYSPDRMNVAVGWRELYGKTLVLHLTNYDKFFNYDSCTRITHYRSMVRVTDKMNVRYDQDSICRIDCSPLVMRSLQLPGKSWIDSVTCNGVRVDVKREYEKQQ